MGGGEVGGEDQRQGLQEEAARGGLADRVPEPREEGRAAGAAAAWRWRGRHRGLAVAQMGSSSPRYHWRAV